MRLSGDCKMDDQIRRWGIRGNWGCILVVMKYSKWCEMCYVVSTFHILYYKIT